MQQVSSKQARDTQPPQTTLSLTNP